jgi:hypothetical protein
VLFRSIALSREYDNIDEVSQFIKTSITLSYTVKKSDVTRVTTRVLGDHNGSLDCLLREFRGCAQHLFILGLLFTLILAEFFGHLIDCKALTLNSHKNLAFIEDSLVINNTNEHS